MNTRNRILVTAIATTAAAAFWFLSFHKNLSKSTTSTPLATSASEKQIASAQSLDGTRSMSQQMMDRLLALLRAEPDPAKREAIANEAVQHIPRALLAAVLADLKKEYDRALAKEATRAILLRWAWEEPTGAAAWAMQFAEGDIRRDALAAVGAGWTRQNPEALMMWASSLAPADRDWVLLHGASYLARTDLSMFAVWLKALPSTREIEQLTAQTAREWAARNPQAVATAIGEFNGPEYAGWRAHMAAGLANSLSLVDRCDTAYAILDTMPQGPEKQQVLKGVVVGWSQRDPAYVATWLNNVVDQTLRTEMSTLLAGSWFERDGTAAEKWATSLPPGQVSDAVAERAAQYYASRDRAAAQRWTDRISSAEARSHTQAYVQAAQPLQPNY